MSVAGGRLSTNPWKNDRTTFEELSVLAFPGMAFIPTKTGCGRTNVKEELVGYEMVPNSDKDRQFCSVNVYVDVLAIGMAPNSLRTDPAVVVLLENNPLVMPYTQHQAVLDPVQAALVSFGLSQEQV